MVTNCNLKQIYYEIRIRNESSKWFHFHINTLTLAANLKMFDLIGICVCACELVKRARFSFYPIICVSGWLTIINYTLIGIFFFFFLIPFGLVVALHHTLRQSQNRSSNRNGTRKYVNEHQMEKKHAHTHKSDFMV